MDTNSIFRKAIAGFYNGDSGLSEVQTEAEEIFENLNIPRPSRDITVNRISRPLVCKCLKYNTPPLTR